MKPIFATAAVCVALALGTAASSAATVHWTLAKRVHLSKSATTVAATLKNVNGIAVSGYTPKRTSMLIGVGGTCTRGSRSGFLAGSFTSHGLGAKVPVKLPFGPPNTCRVSLTIAKPTLPAGTTNPITISIWRR